MAKHAQVRREKESLPLLWPSQATANPSGSLLATHAFAPPRLREDKAGRWRTPPAGGRRGNGCARLSKGVTQMEDGEERDRERKQLGPRSSGGTVWRPAACSCESDAARRPLSPHGPARAS
ncbi:hypothetical protein AAFF_G00196650 [Aldrovandia affinis]|uniref:Uncharacterized protein n=1 Tax=Aldrovandia affinis TaxID=143900 RepID=A0AAD7RIV0_9TELE|nr:hypothetical protein AAFF_G00196650 [Aldrovandia affinis]